MSPRNMYLGRAICIRIHVDGYKLLDRDTCTGLYLGDIITMHLCHGRMYPFVSSNRRAIQDTCRRRQMDTSQVDTTCIMCPGVNAALNTVFSLYYTSYKKSPVRSRIRHKTTTNVHSIQS